MSSRPMDQGNFRGAPPQQQQPESTSVIDQYSNFDGTYNSSRDLRVEGQVKGTIVCKGSVHVAQGANVRAAVDADSISVAGELDGEITCRGRLELLPTGRVKGHISTQSLVIHEGAVYEGDMEMGGSGSRARRNRVTDRPELPLDTPLATAPQQEGAPLTEPVADVPEAEPEAASRPSSFIRRFGTQEPAASPPAQDTSDN